MTELSTDASVTLGVSVACRLGSVNSNFFAVPSVSLKWCCRCFRAESQDL
jgi:hypothetical protein